MLLVEPFRYICDACGIGGYDDYCIYICKLRQLISHSDCHALPSTMEVLGHADHPLIHKFFLEDNEHVTQLRKVCNGHFSADDGRYCCSECNHFTHINCAFETGKVYPFFTQEEEEEEEEEEDEPRDLDIEIEENFIDESMDSITHGIEEIDLEDEHFIHQHQLLFTENGNQSSSENFSCSCCEEPLSAPSYSCKQCNLWLHQTRAELLRRIKHPLHCKHPLILFSESPYVSVRNSYCCLC